MTNEKLNKKAKIKEIKKKYKIWLKLKAKGFDFIFETLYKNVSPRRWSSLEVFSDYADPLVVRYLYRLIKKSDWKTLNFGLYNLLGFDYSRFLKVKRVFCIKYKKVIKIHTHKKIKLRNFYREGCIYEKGKEVNKL